MKYLLLPLPLSLALLAVACEGPANQAADAGRSEGDMTTMTAAPPVFQGKGVASAAAAPPEMSARRVGTMSDEVQAGQTPGLDPLQNIDPRVSQPTMIIRTGQAFIEVEKVDAAMLKIRQLAAQVGGYITNSSVSGGRDQIRQATVELKIPAGKYEDAVGSLSSIGKVETVSSSAQDVGEEFVDISARVANSRKLEDRLLNLLATRTGKLEEVLRVERELARVREEIERYEGRLRYLSSRAALSTLTITVHEPRPILGGDPGDNPIGAALRRAWRNFVALVAGFIASLGVLIPLAAVAAAGWLGYRRWRKR